MNSYTVDLGSMLQPNKSTRLYFAPEKKGPVKLDTFSVLKEDGGRATYAFNNPKKLEIAGQKIKDVYDYSVVPYKDAATNKGKYYHIYTSDSDISLYTHDNHFALMEETYLRPKTIQIGEHKLRGDVTKVSHPDGSKLYSVITPNYKIKTIKISPDGTITGPKKSFLERMSNNIMQKVTKLNTVSKLLKKIL